jgi:hypothetical protein
MSSTCLVCGSSAVRPTVGRQRLPAMQNYVYRQEQAARAAKSGRFELGVCDACGFACNSAFDETLLDYDEGYDNSVPSAVMRRYYEEIARHLIGRHALRDGLVVDVGCGKGSFLKVLAEVSPQVRGLGVDPSHEGETSFADGRIRFMRELFSPQQVGERPALIVCRHVLEHIARPVPFLRLLRDAAAAFPGVPFFIEVPDTGWIVEHGAFWDFCYEHCNYFSAPSLRAALAVAGFRVESSHSGFGGQYLWAEARAGSAAETATAGDWPSRLAAYAAAESATIESVATRLAGFKRDGWSLAVWGMATKGIVFSFITDPGRTLFDWCVDVNPNKHGCFVPITAHRIESPEALRGAAGRPLLVVVMNPNYLAEIRGQCRALGLEPSFVDAAGTPL